MEGVRLVEEALSAGLKFRGALVAPDLDRTSRGSALRVELERHAVPVEEVSARTLDRLADTETPQGIVAVVEPRRWTVDELSMGERGGVVLVVDGVQDPGNVGTLIRTAHALGAAGTVVLRGSADVVSPKALRAAMGATFRHPVVVLDDSAFIAWARRHNVTLWAAASAFFNHATGTEGVPGNFLAMSSACWSRSVARAGSCLGSEERRVGKECRSRWSPYH